MSVIGVVSLVSGILLFLLIIYFFYNRIKNKEEINDMEDKEDSNIEQEKSSNLAS